MGINQRSRIKKMLPAAIEAVKYSSHIEAAHYTAEQGITTVECDPVNVGPTAARMAADDIANDAITRAKNTKD